MIKPTKEIVIPTGPEQYSYQFLGAPNFLATGVTSHLVLQLQRFRANTDGTSPTKTATPTEIPLAVTDPHVVAFVTSVEAAIQTLVTAKGL